MYFLFLMFLSTLGVSAVIEIPQNVAAIVGSDVIMSCKDNSSKSITWLREKGSRINRGNTITSEFQGYNFSISNEDVLGQELLIKAVHLEHAGVYRCAADGEEKYAELIVLESQPQCEVTNGTKPNELRCSVKYHGNWRPNITWTYNGRTLPGRTNPTNYSVSSTVEANGSSSTDFSEYRCITYFTSGSAKEPAYAKNLPSNFSCNLDGKSKNIGEDPNSPHKKDMYVTWIVIGVAAIACLTAISFAIVMYARKHPEVCKKSFGPDIVQHAGPAQPGENVNGEQRVNAVQREAENIEMVEADEPNDDIAEGRVYAEVLVCERNLPLQPRMHDSPAWNYAQASPAISHCSRHFASQSPTPRNGSPIIGFDGTQYLDINSVATIPGPSGKKPRRPPARLPTNKYHPAIYAPIDHTARPPPPPPPSDD